MMAGTTAQSLYALAQSLVPAEQREGSVLPLIATKADESGMRQAAHNPNKIMPLIDIAKRYNVENMSPRAFSAMSRALFENGYISFKDHALLSFQSQSKLSGQAVTLVNQTDPDETMNFVSHWKVQLQTHKQSGELKLATNDKRMLNVLENLSVLGARRS